MNEQFILLNNLRIDSLRFLHKNSYNDLICIKNPDRTLGFELYLIPMDIAKTYETTKDKQLLGEERTLEFIDSLPRALITTVIV